MEKHVNEVSLRHVFWKVMMRWKIWIVCAIIFAFLVPGINYMKSMRVYHTLQIQSEAQSQVTFSNEEQQQIEDVKKLTDSLTKSREYIQNSILMNIDPYHESVVELQYYIDSDYVIDYTGGSRVDYTSAIANAYVDYALHGLDMSDIWKGVETDVEDKYLSELIVTGDNLIGGLTTGDINTFSVIVKYRDQEGLKIVASNIEKALNQRQSDIAQKIGEHKLVLLSENYRIQADKDLADYQNSVLILMKSYQDRIAALKSVMTDVQMAELNNENTSAPQVQAVKPPFPIQDVGLGFVIGLAFAIAVLVCCEMLSKRLQETEELVNFYRLRQFGTLIEKSHVKGVTGFLYRLKNRNKKFLTPEELVQMVSSNLELYCVNEKITKLFLTGSEIQQVDKEWIAKITEYLKVKNIQVVYGENIAYDASAMREASETGNVVLVEIAGISIYQEIEKELGMLKDWNVNVIGCIGVE
ncbi:MAG: hypothetical protein PUC12_03725 [Clostridiales bacterium]|nr:hypothetical protein [Clostridiales bacterium]